ncbi:hypothetical protein LNP74_28100 [Klebsiella pneumoniae subsp. pneumoniae]|nr:hypothetical protein [Klebsiella pneumoniae subsp. pneumoniae]
MAQLATEGRRVDDLSPRIDDAWLDLLAFRADHARRPGLLSVYRAARSAGQRHRHRGGCRLIYPYVPEMIPLTSANSRSRAI